MPNIREFQNPLAITMWDSSWLRRRYKGGGFEDWDMALDELVERGYNAVRIDVFPHLIAKAPDGTLVDVFKDPPGTFPHFLGMAQWGNEYTIYINPRKSVVEFIRKCQEHDVFVGLSTWFRPTDDQRNAQIQGAQELTRVWDETLAFLDENKCLNNVIYVDILNEYPICNCFYWLSNTLGTMSQPLEAGKIFNTKQVKFYWDFINEVIFGLKAKWNDLDIFTSQTYDYWKYDLDRDYSNSDMLDMHLWIAQYDEFVEGTGYFEDIHPFGTPEKLYRIEKDISPSYIRGAVRYIPQDYRFADIYATLWERWQTHKPAYKNWLEARVKEAKNLSDQFGIPLGNTEGWGLINWCDHPLLKWDIIKEAGLIGARLGSKYGYSFNCSSNFCHPQFLGMWEDVAWHQKVTAIIKAEEQ